MVVAEGRKPRRLTGVIGQIRMQRRGLNPAERRVAEAILKSPERTVYLPISELARVSGVSEGTVVRFCQTIGVRGYQALKLALAVDLVEPERVIHEDVGPEDAGDTGRVAQKVFNGDIQALRSTLASVRSEDLDATLAALGTARQIEFFAVGTSLPIAFDAYTHLLRIGLPVGLEFDVHIQLMRASLLGKEDVAVAISHSGSSREPVECLALARRNGVRTIAITGTRPSPLTNEADISLMTVSSETRYREEAMASRIAQLSLLDTVYVCLALRRPTAAIETLRATSEALANHRL